MYATNLVNFSFFFFAPDLHITSIFIRNWIDIEKKQVVDKFVDSCPRYGNKGITSCENDCSFDFFEIIWEMFRYKVGQTIFFLLK